MRKIFIDPGHGGTDPGAVANGLRESEIALDVSLMLEPLLRSAGLDVRLSRRTDTAVDIGERWQGANAWGADLFLSIHANAGGGTGIETLVPTASPNNPARDLAANRRLAETVSASLANRFDMRLRRANGVMLESETRHGSVAVLRNTAMTAVLVECGFVDAPAGSPDLDVLGNRRQEIAQAIADGVFRHFGASAGTIAPAQSQGLTWPVPGFPRVSSPFGMRDGTMHNGIDIARNLSPLQEILGAEVVAAADGRVTESRFGTCTGNVITIDHGSGVQTRYMHNQRNFVAEGQAVRQGLVIASVGSTGRSTAPHLHFEIIENGRHVDPLTRVSPPALQARAPANPPPAAPPPQPAQPQTLHRVRVGAFSTRKEADAVRDRLRDSGHADSFVVEQDGVWSAQAGTFASREKAELLADALRVQGFAGAAVAPDGPASAAQESRAGTVPRVSQEDKRLLTELVHWEARGEDEIGQVMVANVVFNRMKSPLHRNQSTVREVIFHPGAFAPVSLAVFGTAEPSARTVAAVDRALAGEDFSLGATFFHSVFRLTPEVWHERAVRDGRLVHLFDHGGHRFYREA